MGAVLGVCVWTVPFLRLGLPIALYTIIWVMFTAQSLTIPATALNCDLKLYIMCSAVVKEFEDAKFESNAFTKISRECSIIASRFATISVPSPLHSFNRVIPTTPLFT